MYAMSLNIEGLVDTRNALAPYSLNYLTEFFRFRIYNQQELIAPQPGRQFIVPDTVLQPAGDLPQQFIPASCPSVSFTALKPSKSA